MADASCNICLDQLNTPLSIPCGHLHCEKCLLDYIEGSSDAHKANCPTCRTPFSLVAPNLACIPKKYHEFILPTTRRVYFDVSPKTDYKNRIMELERRVNGLERDKVLLREQCNQSMASTRIHAVGQANAMKEVEGARNSMAELRQQLEDMNMLCLQLKEQNERLMNIQPYAETAVNCTGATSPESPSRHNAMRPICPMPTRHPANPSHSNYGTNESMHEPQSPLRKRPRTELEQEGHEPTINYDHTVDHTRRPMVPYNYAPAGSPSINYNQYGYDIDEPTYSPHEHYAAPNTTYNQYPQSAVPTTTQIPQSQSPHGLYSPSNPTSAQSQSPRRVYAVSNPPAASCHSRSFEDFLSGR